MILLCNCLAEAWLVLADAPADALQKSRTLWKDGQRTEALAEISRLLENQPRNVPALWWRAQMLDALGKHDQALTDLDLVLKLKPDLAEAQDLRGAVHFKLGNIQASLADFDRYLAARPADGPGHWRRGITCYYAGAFEEGKKQFEGYEKVDTNDVENAVWRYLCMAPLVGVKKSEAEILKIGNDRRIPMMTVYAMFSGKATPADVLAAARAGNPGADELRQRLFYAHLYIGLYHEAQGDKAQALEHIRKAAEEYRISHYMGDVARVHLKLLTK
jgi:lipoprotein NlpI